MSREEAIKMLKKARHSDMSIFDIDYYYNALDMAIAALKVEPCEDVVSRQAVLELVADYDLSMGQVVRNIYALPPVTPKQRTGHWVEENINEWSRKVFCSECGCQPPFEHVSNGDVYSASGYGVSNKTKFCPNCGARLEEQE